jgi:DNA-binding GntR family transcriptional regulator
VSKELYRFDTLEPHESLRDRVEETIAAAIITGEMAPGEVFSAPVLAVRFQVSATPVREAMQKLEKRGLVEIVRNKGFRVTEVSEEGLRNLSEVRHYLEPQAMAQLATRFPLDELERVRALADRIVRGAADEDLLVYLAADKEFHLALLGFLGNPMLVEVVADLRDRTRLVGLTSLLRTDQLRESALEHHRLLDLLVAGDAEGARDLMHQHIGHVVGWWAGLEENGGR